MSKVKQIRPSLGFNNLLDADLLTRGRAIHAGTKDHPDYRDSPVEPAVLEAALDSFAVSITAALDGSKVAIAERRKRRQEVLRLLRLIGHHVESACRNDVALLLSSGFELASWTRSAPKPPESPRIVRVDQGHSGQLLINIKAIPKARSYELRYAAQETGGTPGAWATTTVTAVKKPAAINNLTPGVIYSFQVRAFNRHGGSDWSEQASRMCI